MMLLKAKSALGANINNDAATFVAKISFSRQLVQE